MSKHDYTAEQERYIQDNADNVTRRQLMSMFNAEYGTNLSYSAITQKCVSLGCEPKLNRFKSDGVISWLAEKSKTLSWKDLTSEFEEAFEVSASEKSLNRILYEQGIRKYGRHHFTQEQREWLSDGITKYTYPELTRRFNEQFGANCTQGSIQQQCLFFLSVQRGENRVAYNALPISATTERKYDGLVYIKVAESRNRRESWKPLQKVLWERANGRKVGKDEAVIFLDGNKQNFDIDNLRCVPKKIMNQLNLNSWTGKDEITQCGIKWCELFYAIRDERHEPQEV